MNNRIGPKVEQVWNVAMHVLHTFGGVVINSTAYHLGRNSLHLLLLKSSTELFFISEVHQEIQNVTKSIPMLVV